VVGGAVRDELLGIPHKDEDFLVPGVDHRGLRAALEAHGRVEDMEVHGQLVGVRFHPRDRGLRAFVPAGIELTPPRAERSTGPGHRDFQIVSDPSITIGEDMARRDFTVNAMARRLETSELVDPFGGVTDLARRELHTVSPESFREDPLRLLRALRLVSQIGFDLSGETLTQMRLESAALRHVSAERIGPQDLVRITRALEVFHLTGRPLSASHEWGRADLPFHLLMVGLTTDRAAFYRRLERRCEEMVERGLVDEVRRLLARGVDPNCPAMQGIGYQHVVAYLQGKWPLPDALRIMQRDTKRYAKRQWTWFRREPVEWFEGGHSLDAIADRIKKSLELRGLLT